MDKTYGRKSDRRENKEYIYENTFTLTTNQGNGSSNNSMIAFQKLPLATVSLRLLSVEKMQNKGTLIHCCREGQLTQHLGGKLTAFVKVEDTYIW